jgi:hypothetical protein
MEHLDHWDWSKPKPSWRSNHLKSNPFPECFFIAVSAGTTAPATDMSEAIIRLPGHEGFMLISALTAAHL